MGRRALRKIPASCYLSGHLLRLESMQPPFISADHFPAGSGRSLATAAPSALTHPTGGLEVEVGSGKVLFLAGAADAHPERNFLGIEIAKKYAEFIAARLARQGSANAKIIAGDAEIFFRDFLRDKVVTAVHIYFPDPWWKKRHHKRRIMNERFLQQVVRVLSAGGRLHFWTDVEEYYQLSLELIHERIALQGPVQVPEQAAQHPLDYRTHFERRTRLVGLPVYRAEFIKPHEPLTQERNSTPLDSAAQERTTSPNS